MSTLPEAIGEWITEYEQSIAFEMKPDNPYLFSMASDWERSHSSSGWTAIVKAVMLRHAGVAAPPKLLRTVFCTHLRSAEGVDEELLKSCAHAMKHQQESLLYHLHHPHCLPTACTTPSGDGRIR